MARRESSQSSASFSILGMKRRYSQCVQECFPACQAAHPCCGPVLKAGIGSSLSGQVRDRDHGRSAAAPKRAAPHRPLPPHEAQEWRWAAHSP
eukprot:scaffold165381_cov28-Tisochrysis_lutea.AAC.2